MPLQAGTRLGPYEIIALIGAGGMGEVWLATELRLGRKVALKLLPPNLTSDAVRISRFEQEARAASALNHPNVCTIYALDETSGGQHYIAMEYVEGETLRRRLVSSRLSLREALDIAIQVAAALSVAHAAGIVHRDIKPENVMLRPDGVVKVLDFGLAKLAAVVPNGADITQMSVNTDAGHGRRHYFVHVARADPWSGGGRADRYLVPRGDALRDSRGTQSVRRAERQRRARCHSTKRACAGGAICAGRPGRRTADSDEDVAEGPVSALSDYSGPALDLQALRDDLPSHASSGSAPVTNERERGSNGAQRSTRWVSSRRLGVATVTLIFLGAVAAFWWLSARRNAPTVPSLSVPKASLTQLTANPPELAVTSAVSPDGKYLAYADPTGLHIRVIDTGETQRVPDSRGMAVFGWSADGTKVQASRENGDSTAWDIPLMGGTRRRTGRVWKVSDQAVPSRDGSRILTVTHAGELTVSTGGAQSRLLVRPQNAFDNMIVGTDAVASAMWAVDGLRVLFARHDSPYIESMSPDGGTPANVFTAPQGLSVANVGVEVPGGRMVVPLRRAAPS